MEGSKREQQMVALLRTGVGISRRSWRLWVVARVLSSPGEGSWRRVMWTWTRRRGLGRLTGLLKFSYGDDSIDPCPSGRSPAPTPCQPWRDFLCGPMSVWLGGILLSTSVAAPDGCAFWKKRISPQGAHPNVHWSTPTAGMEAALDMMLLDLHAQWAAVQVIIQIWGRNHSCWDGIGHGRLRGHLFWGGKILRGVDLAGDHTDKWKAKDLFYDKWMMRWSDLPTCCQTKFWLEDPGCLGDTLARLDCLTLGLAL